MVSRFVTLILSFSLVCAIPQIASAQAGRGNSTSDAKASGPKKQLATILFSGIAGAVLGLSTLSFYGRPQEKLSNIAVGFAFGVIIGAGYTTYKAATAPRDFYKGAEMLEQRERDEELRASRGERPFRVSWNVDF